MIKIAEKINAGLGRFFDRVAAREKTTVFFLFVISFLVRLSMVNFSSLLQKDAYVYFLKAIEIAHGNFIPSQSQAVGLSLFSAPFFLIFGNDSLLHNMAVAKVVSCLFGAAVIFPIYLLVKELADRRTRLIALLIFSFWSVLVFNAAEFLTEPLFSFFFLFSLYFSVVYIKRRRAAPEAMTHPDLPLERRTSQLLLLIEGNSSIYLSFFFAGLAYYVRPNGFFLLAILLLVYLVVGFKNLKKLIIPLLIGVVIFWATAAPFLWQRYEAFGSPFTYGENDKYWVEDYNLIWANNIPVPSFGDYLKSHTPKQMFDRFAVEGFGRVMFDLFRPKDLPLLCFFLFVGLGFKITKKEYWPLYISLAVFVGGLSLIYYVFNTSRHVLPLFPILIIFMAVGVNEVLKNHKYKELLIGLFIVCFILLSLTAYVKGKNPAAEMPDWAVWAAQNIKGKIGIVEGGDYVMMNLADASTAGVGQKDLYAPVSGLSVTKPGYFYSLSEALSYFKQIDMNYVLLDNHLGGRGYLKQIESLEYSRYFKEVYSNADSDSAWKVKIYQINYGK
jgi:4-amino-4-deoxy-L-arabinose transferase-like glycosyltransferase